MNENKFLDDSQTGEYGLHLSHKWIDVYSKILGIKIVLEEITVLDTMKSLLYTYTVDREKYFSVGMSPSTDVNLPSMNEWMRFTHQFGHIYFGSFSAAYKKLASDMASEYYRVYNNEDAVRITKENGVWEAEMAEKNHIPEILFAINVFEDARIDAFFSKEYVMYMNKRVKILMLNSNVFVRGKYILKATQIILNTINEYCNTQYELQSGLSNEELQIARDLSKRIIPFVGWKIVVDNMPASVSMSNPSYMNIINGIELVKVYSSDGKKIEELQYKDFAKRFRKLIDDICVYLFGVSDKKGSIFVYSEKIFGEGSSQLDSEKDEGWKAPVSANNFIIRHRQADLEREDNGLCESVSDLAYPSMINHDIVNFEGSDVSWEEVKNTMAGEIIYLPGLQKILKEYIKDKKMTKTSAGKFSVRGYMKDRFSDNNYAASFKKIKGNGGLESSRWLFLIDISGSTRRQVLYQEISVLKEFNKIFPSSVKIKIFGFNAKYEEFKGDKSDKDEVVKYFEEKSKFAPGGGTSWSFKLLEMLIEYAKGGWQIVILTDGMINAEKELMDRVVVGKEFIPIIIIFTGGIENNFKQYVIGKDYITFDMFTEPSKRRDAYVYMKRIFRRYN